MAVLLLEMEDFWDCRWWAHRRSLEHRCYDTDDLEQFSVNEHGGYHLLWVVARQKEWAVMLIAACAIRQANYSHTITTLLADAVLLLLLVQLVSKAGC